MKGARHAKSFGSFGESLVIRGSDCQGDHGIIHKTLRTPFS